ncbi:DUF4097 family beta strand repeat-containing protein [Bacillus sp. NEB1478]|uniref:DUF4097 family beta strand repeat-containing protein n=1 Tax=Bacillus sp. NEB1478 TaxID=3073816 RepID=UPI0028730062|nr:DUF4097 family beta strand repeat-containing protein [Bacillus sp. NEB1478]WNB90794.1 DUF4097 family beta strand repeat-containing protein [Bacillus sp. NEB1478]
MNVKRILRIAIILIGLAIAGNAVLFLIGKSPFNSAKVDQKRLIDSGSITDIKVSSNISDVKIIPNDSEKIEVHMRGRSTNMNTDNVELAVKQNGNKLTIHTAHKKPRFLVVFNDYDLLIKMPNKDFKKLTVKTDAAEINLKEISAHHFYLNSDVGDITLHNVNGKINAESDVGDMNMYVDEITKDITAKSNVGDISVITKNAPKNLQTHLKNNLGDETVELPNEKNGMIGTGGPLVSMISDVGDLTLSLQK